MPGLQTKPSADKHRLHLTAHRSGIAAEKWWRFPQRGLTGKPGRAVPWLETQIPSVQFRLLGKARSASHKLRESGSFAPEGRSVGVAAGPASRSAQLPNILNYAEIPSVQFRLYVGLTREHACVTIGIVTLSN